MTRIAALIAFLPVAALAEDVLVWTYSTAGSAPFAEILPNGNILITEKSSDRVVEVTPTRPLGGTEVRQFTGLGQPDTAHGLASGHLLVAATAHHRVVELDPSGAVVWSFGTGTTGCSDTELSQPGDAVRTANGDTLIADQVHARVLRVNPEGSVVWRFGSVTCTPTTGPNDELFGPFRVFETSAGALLLVDPGNRRVLEIDSLGTVTRRHGTGVSGFGAGQLNVPVDVAEDLNGNWFVADAFNHRVISVVPAPNNNPIGTVVFQHGVSGSPGGGANQLDRPYGFRRTRTGTLLIAELNGRRLQEFSPLEIGFGPRANVAVSAGECSGEIPFQVQDVYGQHHAPTATPLTATLTLPSGVEAFTEPTCSAAAPSTSDLAPGPTSLYLRAVAPGSYLVTGVASSFGSRPIRLDATSANSGGGEPSPLREVFQVGCACTGVSGGSAAQLVCLWLIVAAHAAKNRSEASPVRKRHQAG